MICIPAAFRPETPLRTSIFAIYCSIRLFSPDFLVPEIIDGNTLTATVVDLNAWVEYEFRVLARNSVGVGEPSPVSVRTRTEDAGRASMPLPPLSVCDAES